MFLNSKNYLFTWLSDTIRCLCINDNYAVSCSYVYPRVCMYSCVSVWSMYMFPAFCTGGIYLFIDFCSALLKQSGHYNWYFAHTLRLQITFPGSIYFMAMQSVFHCLCLLYMHCILLGNKKYSIVIFIEVPPVLSTHALMTLCHCKACWLNVKECQYGELVTYVKSGGVCRWC